MHIRYPKEYDVRVFRVAGGVRDNSRVGDVRANSGFSDVRSSSSAGAGCKS